MPAEDKEPATRPWHAMEVSAVAAAVSSSDRGLAAEEAESRLVAFGPNRIDRKQGEGLATLLWRQINNPLIWVLLASTVVAVALGKVTDGSVVLAVVVLNAIVGMVQEFRAGKAIDALAAMVPEQCTVLRDGVKLTVPAADLVTGDVVLLEAGERVPADMRIFTAKGLQVQEAALTGEAVPAVKKPGVVDEETVLGDRTNLIYSGTLVTSGTTNAMVVATGMGTELGRISKMLAQATELETPLTRSLGVIARYITVGIVAVTLILVGIGVWRQLAVGAELLAAVRETLMFAIALAVGAIPEGLPAIVTIALAIGVQRMAARKAIVRKLPAVETLGSTTVICSDKTGTLTRNQMTGQGLWTPSDGAFELEGVGYEPVGRLSRDGSPMPTPPESVSVLLSAGALCNEATLANGPDGWKTTGDPTEIALVVAAHKAGVVAETEREAWPRIDAVPFSSELQLMATLHRAPDGQPVLLMKGAPEAVISRCEHGATGAGAEVERLASNGMRVLAVAKRPYGADTVSPDDLEAGFTLAGLIGLIDPPRPEAIRAIEQCHGAGVTVKMITGDHRLTAAEIGRQLGIANDEPALTGAELSKMDDEALAIAVDSTNVFARVLPEHKLRLVRALQANGHVVAMTGDGVNDAPALKQANIGVAMGITGTAAAKEVADIVLGDDNFASIAAAVEEGRRVYDNLIKSLAFVLPTNIGLALIMIYAIILLPFDAATGGILLPMEPVQLLWINLVATVALALPLAFEAKEPDVMDRPPRLPKAPVFDTFVIGRTIGAALLMTVAAVGLFHWVHGQALASGLAAAAAASKAQSMAVTAVLLFEVFYLQSCRSLRGSVWSLGLFSNRAIFFGVAAMLLLQAAFLYAPPMQAVFSSTALGLYEWGAAILVGAAVMPAVAIEKAIRSLLARGRSPRRGGDPSGHAGVAG